MHWIAWIQDAAEEVEQIPAAGTDWNRVILLSLMVLLPLVATLIVVVGGLRLKGLLARIPRISTRAQLDDLRKEAVLHRTLGGVIKPLLGIANALFIVDLFVFDGPLSDILYSIVPSIVSILVSLPFQALEAQANALPCDNEELKKEWLEIRQG